MSNVEQNTAVQPTEAPAADQQPLTGRSVFAVDTSAAGIVVRTAFVTEQNQVMEMPAVFPDLPYALSQIDALRQLVIERFTQAAQVGAQVLAQQAQQQAAQAAATPVEVAAPH